MGWFGFALALVGGLGCIIFSVVISLTNYNLSYLPYLRVAHFILVVGTLVLFVDVARTFMARRKIRLGKKDQMEAK